MPQTYFTFANLHRAYTDCRKHKNNTHYHRQFAYNLEENLLSLQHDLQTRTYQPRRSIAFVVHKPKTREIFAADFRDRVVHHLLYNYLAPHYEKRFIYDSWACRPNKGTHGAVMRLQQQQRQLQKAAAVRQGYYLKMDVKSFFTSIDKTILYGIIARKIKNPEILWLAKVNIFHDCARDKPPKLQSQQSFFDDLPADKSLFRVARGKGLPIGNLTSQFYANVYLDELDQFIKHQLGMRYYIRYVDDFVLLHSSQVKLRAYEKAIMQFTAARLQLAIHPRKTIVRPIKSGIDFLGYVIRPNYMLVRKRVAYDWRNKVQLFHDIEKRQHVFDSYLAHASWANAYGLSQHVAQKYGCSV